VLDALRLDLGANEPWGWAPFHYGRWGHSAAFGWYWMPGRTWARVGELGRRRRPRGWCALGRHDRPVVAWGHRYDRRGGFDGRRAVPRSRFGIRDGDAWNVVRDGELGKRDWPRGAWLWSAWSRRL